MRNVIAMILVAMCAVFVSCGEDPEGSLDEQAVVDTAVASLTDSSEPMAYTNTCGACSIPRCRYAPRGTPCAWSCFGSVCWANKWCIPTLTEFCPGTQDWDCQCARFYL